MLFTFADLDDRRRAEQTLKDSEERFEIAFKLVPMPTFLPVPDAGRILPVNEAVVDETGYAVEDVVDRDMTALAVERRARPPWNGSEEEPCSTR